MASKQDEQVAKIVLERKFCEQAALDACLQMQAQDPDPADLVDILLFNGVITDEQRAEVLKALAPEPAPAPKPDPKPEPKPEPEPEPPPPPGPPEKTVTSACIMCDAVFDAAVDAGGRVKCTECGTSFVPK